MKNLLSISLLLFLGNFCFAQNKTITKLLNSQLQKEYAKFYNDNERKNFIITQPFRIDEDNVMHFGFIQTNPENGEKMSIKRQVSMDKIVQFDKDIYACFYTLENDVTEITTRYDENGNEAETTTEKTQIFSTEINKDNDAGGFMKKVTKALLKAGYDIDGTFWMN